MTERTYTTSSAEETEALGRELGGRLRPGDVVLLDGPLGAGKTCLAKGLAAALGVDPVAVCSPSFTLVNEYAGAGDLRVVHADGYRLPERAPLDDLGLEDAQADGAVLLVEWSRAYGEAHPGVTWRITLTIESEENRRIEVAPSGGGSR
jgi:tRNA threonylcarbamoyladenosine biosynthesis protein TsaE